ncbi:MAG TPA: succinate dehydrogenase, hydrophobic membrane anchor protein [Alphaproteobacteria bacterium]|nr:succinate dehydrogenase, hydrophobic membrane anchor protein [Alphaproteobacteria bacterium]
MSSKKKQSIQTPLAKAKGLGSAHTGTHHWLMQRVTALAVLPLIFWVVYSMFKLQGADYLEFTTWLAQPMNAVLSILFIIAGFYHAVLGNQVIIEDYISCKWFRMTKLIGQKLFFIALAVACIFSILKIAFTAGV